MVNTADITTSQGCRKLLIKSMELGQIAGIFNLAVALRDSIIENQTVEKFAESLAPKANATRYLDELSRSLCPRLRHFVIFSSASCGRGNAGQSNYGMANSIMERIIEKRVQDKLPGKAIQWGAIGEVGLVAEMAKGKIDFEVAGTLQQRILSCLNVMDLLLTSNEPVVSSMVVADKRAVSKCSMIDTVLNILGVNDIKTLSMNATLSEVGMDSLMAVEIKQALERDFEIMMTAQDMRELTIAKLQQLSESTAGAEALAAPEYVPEERTNIIFKSLGYEATSTQNLLPANTTNQDSDACALLIPGIEGVNGPSFQKLAESLKLPSYVLQLHNSWDKVSLADVISVVSDDVRNLFRGKKRFHIIAHSFGTVVAIELCKMLEKAGLKGHLTMIDGSLLLTKKLLNSVQQGQNDLEDVMLLLIALQVMPEVPTSEIQKILEEEKDFDAKIARCLVLMKERTYSEQYLRQVGYAFLNRSKVISDAIDEPTEKVQASMTLLKPTVSTIVDIPDDYELTKYTSGAVRQIQLVGNHLTILENEELPQIINAIDVTKL